MFHFLLEVLKRCCVIDNYVDVLLLLIFVNSQAAMAITCLAHLDALKRRGPRPCSLYLSHLVECVQRHAPKSGLIFRQQQSLLQHLEKVWYPAVVIIILIIR